MRQVALLVLACCLLGLAACPNYVDRIYEGKLSNWQAAHPDEEPTPEVLADLRAQSIKEAEAETGTAISAGTQIATGLSTGNILAIIMGGITLLGIGTGVYKKAKGKKK